MPRANSGARTPNADFRRAIAERERRLRPSFGAHDVLVSTFALGRASALRDQARDKPFIGVLAQPMPGTIAAAQF
jgi:hypothetical protein